MEYSSKEVTEKTGISYRQLDYWTRSGLLTPDVEAMGSGSQRRWSDVGILRVMFVAALYELGTPREIIDKALDEYNAMILDDHHNGFGPFLVTTSGEIFPNLITPPLEIISGYHINIGPEPINLTARRI